MHGRYGYGQPMAEASTSRLPQAPPLRHRPSRSLDSYLPQARAQHHARNSTRQTETERDDDQTPFTISPPLPSDFDAFTATHDQGRWSRYTRGLTTTADPTSYGLLGDLEAVTATQTRATTRATTPAHHQRQRRNTIATRTGDDDASFGYVSGEREREMEMRYGRQESAVSAAYTNGNGVGTGSVQQAPSLRRMKPSSRIRSGDVQTRFKPERDAIDYEMVETRIVEEGPERTVSISKWREQVIRETDEDDDMSVYYLNAEGQQLHTEHRGVRREASNNLTQDNSRSRLVTESTRTLIPPDPFTFFPSSPPFHAKKEDLTTGAIGTNGKLPTNKNAGLNSQSSISSIHLAPPKAKDSLSSPVAPASPNGANVPPAPNNATNNTSGNASSLESVLNSCQPSLLHIGPVLHLVGISRGEDLHALARLGEDTRNREVRSEVLRMGVSLLEWAVLLDRVERGL
uniref:Uncharacterized protein n=1 Tax=Mycena chlorophos TaxID=658473 RepID=A0ABQ0M3S5_MYCCL|nr:predicted protein [Mycena chlorophos]